MALPASPWRHWRSYGTEPLPTAAEAMTEPMRAFPSWFLKVTCDRCGKDRMLNQAGRATCRSASYSPACVMTAVAGALAGWSC
jgi:hypothetical protein